MDSLSFVKGDSTLKHSVYGEAYIVFIAEYDRITTAMRLGNGLHTWIFAKHWEVSTVGCIVLYSEAELIS